MDLAEQFVPYVNITAKLEDKPDQAVFAKYDGRYFPTVLFLDPVGERLFEFRPRSRRQTAEAVADARALMRVRSRLEVDPHDPAAKAEKTVVRVLRGLAELPDDELRELAATEGVEPALRRRVEEHLVLAPVRMVLEEFEKQRGEVESQEQMLALIEKTARKLYELYKSGTPAPPEGSRESMAFWFFVLETAHAERDREVGLKAIETILQSPGGEAMREELEKRRAELESYDDEDEQEGEDR